MKPYQVHYNEQIDLPQKSGTNGIILSSIGYDSTTVLFMDHDFWYMQRSDC